MRKNFKNVISFLIIITLLVMPFSSIPKANAQLQGLGGGTNSISGYIKDLSPLITKLPGCTSALESGLNDLWKGIKKIVRGKNSKVDKYTSTEGLTDLAVQTVSTLASVPTESFTANQLLGDLKTQTISVKKTGEDTNKQVSSVNKNQTCLNAIGKAVVKMLVDRMTIGIVNWINTGNFGDPFFIEDTSKFFKDLAKNEILKFGAEMNDAKNFPFARNFMMGVAGSFNNKFQDNARYSMDTIMRQQQSLSIGIPMPYTPADFAQDFSMGGWGAWDAMTQYPQNNPLGFHLMASNELASRLTGTGQSPAQEIRDQIDRAGGYLDMKVCADPRDVTKEEDDAAIAAGVTPEEGTRVVTTSTYTSPTESTLINPLNITFNDQTNDSTTSVGISNTTTTYRRCTGGWKTVTPGGAIGNALTKSMDNSQNALLSAETLNDAIAAILDAALAKLSSTLMNEGLAAVSESDIEKSYDITGYEDDGLSTPQADQIDQDFSSYQRDSSPWLQSHPDFDIRKDINQALIDEQRIYTEKLKELNYTLLHTDDIESETGYGGLIPTIYQLDYCIPGPQPGWEEEGQLEIDRYAENISSVNYEGISGTLGYELLGTFTLGIGTAIIDWGNSAFQCDSDGGKQTADFLVQAINQVTGISNISPQAKLCAPVGAVKVLDRIMEEYKRNIKKHYNLFTLPSVVKEAENKFNKTKGYEQMIKDNKEAIVFQEGIIKRLETIKNGVEALNSSSTTYENDLIIWKNSFARISTSLVSGGDIAYVADLTNQTKDELNYVYNDLLKGPTGCEKELQTSPIGPWQIAVQVRPDYPKPHLYNYSKPLNETLYTGDKGFLSSVFIWDGFKCGDAFSSSNNCGCVSDSVCGNSGNAHHWTDVIDVGGVVKIDSPGFAASSALVWEKFLKIY